MEDFQVFQFFLLGAWRREAIYESYGWDCKWLSTKGMNKLARQCHFSVD